MFVRISNSGGRQYLRLVQSYRDDNGKVRQRQIAQLGRLDQMDEREVNGLIDSLRRFTGHGSDDDATEPVFERAREVGTTWVMCELWQALGLDQLLRQVLRSSRRDLIRASTACAIRNRSWAFCAGSKAR